jgi:uncharacterized protein (TIGR02646 family)
MIRVTFVPPTTAKWKKWVSDAQREHDALDRLFRRRRKISFKESLYRRLRDDIFAPFYGKCAYCETLIAPSAKEAVEHFRPKSEIKDEHGNLVRSTGYYWIAYHWENLLPTCAKCNGANAKGTRFPVTRRHATSPRSDLKREGALLLHPYFDQPEKHLELEPLLGQLQPKTRRGRVTIRILGLNRKPLREDREQFYSNVRFTLWGFKKGVPKNSREGKSERAKLARIMTGQERYAFAARSAIRQFPGYKKLLKSLGLPTNV